MTDGGPVGNFNGTYINNSANIYAPQTIQNNYPQPAPQPTYQPQSAYAFNATNQFNQFNQIFAQPMAYPMMPYQYPPQQPAPMPYPMPQQPPQQETGGNSMMMLMMMLMNMLKKGDCQEGPRPHQGPCRNPIPQQPALNPALAFNEGAGLTGKVWGDPHFVNMKTGKTYDINPAAGKTVYVFGDKNVQINGRVGKWGNGDATVFKEIGMKLGNHQLKATTEGAPVLDGKTLEKGVKVTLDNGNTVVWDGKDINFETTTIDAATGKAIQEYSGKIVVTDGGKEGKYMDVHMNVGKDGFGRDGVKPEGLLGRSAWATIDKVDSKTGAGALAEGTTLDDYTLQGNGDDALFAGVRNGAIARFGR